MPFQCQVQMKLGPDWKIFSCLFVLLAAPLFGQSRMQIMQNGGGPPTLSVQQAPLPAGRQSVNGLSTTIRVDGPFASSVVAQDASGVPLHLTIDNAITRALRHNLGIYAAAARSASSRGALTAIRSALLPSVMGSLSESVDKVNLASEGFDASDLPSIGAAFPSVIGPFHLYNAQAQVSYSAFDMVAIRNLLAARASTNAAAFSEKDAREQIVLAVAATYLQVQVQQARVDSASSQLKYARSVYEQAVAQKGEGSRSALEANRSRVQMQTREQQLFAQQGELTKQKMRLARMIGLAADCEIELADSLPVANGQLPQLNGLLSRAAQRPDVEAARAELESAEQSRRAASSERLPAVHINGNVGEEGANFHSGRLVYQGSASLNVQLFDGGAARADMQQADAAITQKRASLSAKIEDVRFEVRSAWVDEETASKQLNVAEENRKLALQTLEQTIDRFTAGASDSVEVAQSQDMVAGADEDYIASLFALRLAEMSLARSVGSAEQDVPRIVKGERE